MLIKHHFFVVLVLFSTAGCLVESQRPPRGPPPTTTTPPSTCEEKSNCWDQCFINPPQEVHKNAYMQIYRAAIGIRNLFSPSIKSYGSAYLMDADVAAFKDAVEHEATYRYQRHLASIVAMVQPADGEEDCKGFCASKFHHNLAYYSHDWPCKDRCQAHSFFNNDPGMTSYTFNSQPSFIRGSERLSEFCFKRHKGCMGCATQNELLISFVNSGVHQSKPPSSVCGGNPYYCATINVNSAPHITSVRRWDSIGVTGPIYHLPSTASYRYAASEIAKCMNEKCCTRSQQSAAAEEVDSRQRAKTLQTFSYVDTSSKQVYSYSGTLEDFKRLVLIRYGIH